MEKIRNGTDEMKGYDTNPKFSPNGKYIAWQSMSAMVTKVTIALHALPCHVFAVGAEFRIGVISFHFICSIWIQMEQMK